MRKAWGFLFALGSVLLIAGAATALAGQDLVTYVDRDTLKGMLGDPNLLIIDVRQTADWGRSDKKSSGAVRQDPNTVAVWGPTLPKDKKIVLYCA